MVLQLQTHHRISAVSGFLWTIALKNLSFCTPAKVSVIVLSGKKMRSQCVHNIDAQPIGKFGAKLTGMNSAVRHCFNEQLFQSSSLERSQGNGERPEEYLPSMVVCVH